MYVYMQKIYRMLLDNFTNFWCYILCTGLWQRLVLFVTGKTPTNYFCVLIEALGIVCFRVRLWSGSSGTYHTHSHSQTHRHNNEATVTPMYKSETCSFRLPDPLSRRWSCGARSPPAATAAGCLPRRQSRRPWCRRRGSSTAG